MDAVDAGLFESCCRQDQMLALVNLLFVDSGVSLTAHAMYVWVRESTLDAGTSVVVVRCG